MNRGAWRAIVHGITKSQTGLKLLKLSLSQLIYNVVLVSDV